MNEWRIEGDVVFDAATSRLLNTRQDVEIQDLSLACMIY